MWQKFTELSQKAILSAQQEAVERGSCDVDVLHLLIGIMRVDYDENWQNGSGLVSWMLTSNGVDAQSLYTHIAAKLPQTAKQVDAKEPRLTRNAKRVLERAAHTAWRTRSNYIGPEHLFLAALETPQSAFLLSDFGLDVNDLHRQLSDWLRLPQIAPETKTLSDELQTVLENSRRAATLSGCGRVYGAHLLFAVLNDHSVKTLLGHCEIDGAALQERVKSRLISDRETSSSQNRYSRGAKRVLDLARQEADNDLAPEIHPVHLLLALSQPQRDLSSRWRQLLQPPHANENLDELWRDLSIQTLREHLPHHTDEKAADR